MIAIPNMDKPQNCQKCIDDCLNIPLDCYPDEYGENRKGEKIVCPLIEIVQCKDCKWAKKEEDEGEGNLTCACHIPRFIVPSDGFCYLGERRNDEATVGILADK